MPGLPLQSEMIEEINSKRRKESQDVMGSQLLHTRLEGWSLNADVLLRHLL